MTTIPTHVFVYGSLKAEHSNHQLIQHCDCLGVFNTKDSNYMMTSYHGAFPAVVKDTSYSDYQVCGELYLVEDKYTMMRLDMLESNGKFYQRELVELDGFDEPVWMYILIGAPPADFTNVYECDDHVLFWHNPKVKEGKKFLTQGEEDTTVSS